MKNNRTHYKQKKQTMVRTKVYQTLTRVGQEELQLCPEA